MMSLTGKTTLTRLASIALAAMLATGIAGCDGDDGAPGQPGLGGQQGQPGPIGPTGPAGPPAPPPAGPTGDPIGALDGAITGVTISDSSKIVTVTFAINDAAGRPVTGLTNFEFTIAKLVPATSDQPTQWQSYINRSRLSTGGARVLRATGERAAATEISTGVYRYTFCTDIEAAAAFQYYGSGTEPAGSCPTNVVGRSGVLNSAAAGPVLAGLDLAYDANDVHRIAIASRNGSNSAGTLAQYNAVLDFVPASLPNFQAATANQVVTNESCGACHAADSSDRGRLSFATFHGNTRYDVALCTTCHNASTFDSRNSTDTEWAVIDLATMAHKLHTGVPGYMIATNDYSEVSYPQSVANCRTCHDNGRIMQPANRDPDDAMAWMTQVTQQACNTCHNVDFTNHFGNQPDNVQCGVCHGPTRSLPVTTAHASRYSTPNNPELPAGVGALDYQIASVTVDANNQPIVRFRILLNGTPLNLASLPAGMAFGGGTSPGFKIAWSASDTLPNGTVIAQPVDFNNVGGGGRNFFGLGSDPYAQYVGFSKVDQPRTVGLSAIVASLGAPDAEGYYTTLAGINPTTPVAFPAGAGLRSVAIESFFTFNAGTVNSVNAAGDAAFKGVAGEERREVVDMDSCNTCHEGVGFHSNSGRRNNPNHCAMCHNPELVTSNTFAGFVAGTGGAFSLTPVAGFTEVAQKSNNLKDMLHSIHGAAVREAPFNFIRGTLAGGSGQGLHAYADVTYPAQVADCGACHKPGTYTAVIDKAALPSVIALVPGASETKLPPTTAACWSCHDNTLATAHMAQNSGDFVGVETCVLCHAPGRSAEAHAD